MKRAVVIILLAVAAGWVAWPHVSRSALSSVDSAVPQSGARTLPRGARLNAVLVTVDTLRADRVGRGLTPSIDSLAARGLSFANVRATAPLTLPSHLSLMTGTIPPVHGVHDNGVVFDRKTATIARTLRDAGYRTAAFVGAYVLNRRFGLDEGFETYDDEVRRDVSRAERLEAERPAEAVVDAALAWLNIQHSAFNNQPFFLWLHLYDPHAPYTPPAEYLQKAGGQPYDGEVSYADAQIGRLLAALNSRGLTSSTVVVVTGDHGEGLGEHGEQTHGMLAYDATLRVPLVIAQPGVAPRRETGAASLTDVAPLLLRATGAAPGITEKPEIYAETRYPRTAGWHTLSVLADDRWKLIRSSESELYETLADPGEQHNVAAAHPTVVSAMSAALDRLRAGARPPAAVAPEAAERLRALGYVSGSAASAADDPTAPNPARTIEAWTEFERALGEMQTGATAAAVGTLKRLAAAHPAAPVFQSTYAQAVKDAGNPREALQIYKRMVARWPADARLFHDLAVAARDAGELAEAARAEQAALALDSNSPMALNGLGLLHVDAGRAAEAASSFERATQQDPTNPSYWTNLGNARRALDDRAEAQRAYEKALTLDPDFADALNGLGALKVQGGSAAEAVPLFERALRRDPQLHEARLNLGIALQESGQRDRAASVYRELLATAPSSARREREAATALLKGIGSRF